MKKTVLLLILLLGLACAAAAADGKDLYIDGNVQKLFTSEDGLLSTSTQAVAQTSEGFIWIGGYGGLVRYDGKRCETPAGTYKRITRVSDLQAGQDGELWIATSDKGLFHYRDGEFSSVPTLEGEPVLDAVCLDAAPDGTLYMGTGSGLCAVTEAGIRRLDIPELNGLYIHRLVCAKAGAVLCVTREGGLCAWDGKALRQADLRNWSLRCVCENPAGGYLAGTTGDEVLALDDSLNVTGTTVMEGLNNINDLHCEESGALWLCADNGVAIHSAGGLRMQNLRMDNSVDEMLVDVEGNYWFVSSRQGVLKVSRSQFVDVSRCAGLDSMVVNAIQRLGDTLYIGHDTGLAALSATDYKQLEISPITAALKGVRVRALLSGDDGSLWVGTMKRGLLRYGPDGEITRYTTADYPQLRSDNFRTITPVPGGVLTGTDNGAYFVNEDGVRSVSNDPGALAFRILSAVQFGDTVYLGSDGNGLYLLKDGEIVSHITTEDGLSSNVIMKEYRSDAFDGLWLVTGNDIDFLAQSGDITSISGFPSTNNLDLWVLDNGDAWVFTGSGVYQTTEASLLKDEAPRYQQYRRMDGLPYEVTPNSYACLTDGALMVCGSGGVFSLETDFAEANAGAYPLVVDSLQADGVTVRPDGEGRCVIDGKVKRVDINAYVLTYRTGNPYVFYYLEGFDDDRTVTRLNSLGGIRYTNLNGGSYTFHFGVQDGKTGDVLEEITLPIVKQHPWYERPAVQLAGLCLALALLALITLLVIRVRSGRIKRALEQEYERKEKLHLTNIAYRDYLTGLYNRNYLDVWNARQAEEGPASITFVSVDINNLKVINDRFSHKDGDQLLCEMAGLLKKRFEGGPYTVFRTGGDEFLILARGVNGDEMTAAMERLAEEAAAVSVCGMPITFGYGMCTQAPGAFDFEEGLHRSDLQLLEKKDLFHGRDRGHE